MTVVAVRAPSAQTLLRLGRVSNLPTVWTNVIAGATIANAAATIADLAVVGLVMTAFYVGGMYLNDFFDREIDARERPGRPIPAGDISAGAVLAIGFALLAIGVALLLAPFGPLTAIWGLALAAAIVLYDAWHKGNIFAPVIIGLCRALVYLATGAAVSGEIRSTLIIGATALAAHVIGLTYAAKQENLNQVGKLWPLFILAGPLLFALSGISGWPVVIGAFVLCAVDIAAVQLLARRVTPDAVPRAVSMLIAAICLVDALAVALYGGGIVLACLCASGYVLTRLFQAVIPGT